MRLVLAHGWAFGPALWEPVLRLLPAFRAERADLGFFGPRRTALADGAPPLVVAHSLGLAWALANIPRPWAGLVAVNAFARFTRGNDFPNGVPGRVLRRMQERFAQEPGTVVRDFRARCGAPGPLEADETGRMDAAALGAALDWLARCDERPALAGLACPLLALAGAADPIVPEAMSRDSFAGRALTLVEDGGHLLPLSHAEAVAGCIRALAERTA